LQHHCYVGTALRCQKNDFVVGHTMNFIEDSRGLPMEDYGRPFPLSQDAEASVAAGNSLVAGEGLNVLRAQAVIYSFLNQSCQLIKQSVKEWSSFAAHYDLRGNMQERAENNMTSLQKEHGFTGDGLKAVVLSHYTGPAAPDFKALLRSLNEAIKKSSDHLQKLRRHPPDWMEELHAGREHFWGCIPNAKLEPLSADVRYGAGLAPSDFESQVRAAVVKEVVIRAVEMRLYWQTMKDRVSRVAGFVGGGGGAGGPGDDAFRSDRVHNELRQLYVTIRQAIHAVRGHFVKHAFEASPGLRRLFRRHTASGPAALGDDELLGRTAIQCVADWPSPLQADFDLSQHAVALLYRAVRLVAEDLSLDHVGMGNLADLLAEFTQAGTPANDYVRGCMSPHLSSLLTDLVQLGHLLRQVERVRSYSHILAHDPEMADGLTDAEPGYSMAQLRRRLVIQPHDCDPWFVGDMAAPPYEDLAVDPSPANHQRTVAAEQRLQAFWRWADKQVDDICRRAAPRWPKASAGSKDRAISISVGVAAPRTDAALRYRTAVAAIDKAIETDEPWTNVSYANWSRDALKPAEEVVVYHENAMRVDKQDYDVVKHIFLLPGHTHKEIPWPRFLRK